MFSSDVILYYKSTAESLLAVSILETLYIPTLKNVNSLHTMVFLEIP